MKFEISKLRDNNQLKQFEGKKGHVKWWACKTELNIILNELDVKYGDIVEFLDVKDDLYCIYIGGHKTKDLLSYLGKEITQKPTNMQDGIVYYKKPITPLQRSIYSIFLNNHDLWFKIDEFIDKLFIEVIVYSEIKKETDTFEDLLKKHFYIFNRNSDYHPEMEGVVNNLLSIQKKAKENAENYSKEIGSDDNVNTFKSYEKRNLIYFGAPGTGKSYNLNKDKDDLLKDFPNNYERVTFHPDYSYANFVGTYKPVPDNDSITYEYVPGPFMRILKKAIENPNEPFLLIIEEINRANVAAVFGDVFQILDRNKDNESVYPIDASEDMKTYINQDKIILPNNLFIWATMNSADQGVFPIDTAFKRRWNFKYFSINHNEDLIDDTHVIINNKTIYWNDLRKQINDELLSYKVNEDKLMGPFFAFNEFMNQEIPTETFKDIFKNKIIMYLFEDAARSKRDILFSGAKTENYVTYSEICESFDEKDIEIFCDNIKKELSDED